MLTEIPNQISTDEGLCLKLQSGDEQAENTLLEKYKSYITKIARRYYLVGGEFEDVIQECTIALYQAMRNFRPNKEVKFKTYAVACIRRRMQSAIHKANSLKNKTLSEAISINEFLGNEDFEGHLGINLCEGPDESLIANEKCENLMNFIKKELSVLEGDVMQLYLQGFTHQEIAEKLHIEPRVIDNALNRARNKIRERLQEM